MVLKPQLTISEMLGMGIAGLFMLGREILLGMSFPQYMGHAKIRRAIQLIFSIKINLV